jgi:polysaccharide export outer membrane protein
MMQGWDLVSVKIFFNMNIKINFFCIIIMALVSCTPQKNIVYLQDKGDKTNSENVKKNTFEYIIKPKDQLYIKTVPLNEPSATLLYSNDQSNAASSEMSAYLNGYNVSDSGFVDLPLIGKVFVDGLTITECQKIIQEKVNIYLKNTLVIVKLLNYNITVLGEVNNPGTFHVYKNQINILEVLGLAGDLTIFGNRKQIVLVRQNEGNKMIDIDITDKKLLYSDYFYLQPNDILYIKPTRSKIFGTNPFPFATVLSSITTLILLINYLSK